MNFTGQYEAAVIKQQPICVSSNEFYLDKLALYIHNFAYNTLLVTHGTVNFRKTNVSSIKTSFCTFHTWLHKGKRFINKTLNCILWAIVRRFDGT